MIKLAKEEVKRIHKKQKGSAAEFNACLGGYGAPRDKVTETCRRHFSKDS